MRLSEIKRFSLRLLPLLIVISPFLVNLSINSKPDKKKYVSQRSIKESNSKPENLFDLKKIIKKFSIDKINENPINIDGYSIKLTIIPHLQKEIDEFLKRFDPHYGAFVAIKPQTGEILSINHHSRFDKNFITSLSSKFPSASIFKIITVSALLEEKNLPPRYRTCFHGGKINLYYSNIIDNLKKDRKCETLSFAFANSTNSVFGKLAVKYLNREILKKFAERFGFYKDLEFILNVDRSTANFPSDALEFARTAAGFKNTKLSPFHAALISSAIANNGVIMKPSIFKEIRRGDEVVWELKPSYMLKSIEEKTAKLIKKMMVLTSISGTGKRYFLRRNKELKGIKIGVKTGSLSIGKDKSLHVSWMVGFAPADNPQIAFSSLIVNENIWHIKAGHLAKEALQIFFKIVKEKKILN